MVAYIYIWMGRRSSRGIRYPPLPRRSSLIKDMHGKRQHFVLKKNNFGVECQDVLSLLVVLKTLDCTKKCLKEGGEIFFFTSNGWVRLPAPPRAKCGVGMVPIVLSTFLKNKLCVKKETDGDFIPQECEIRKEVLLLVGIQKISIFVFAKKKQKELDGGPSCE